MNVGDDFASASYVFNGYRGTSIRYTNPSLTKLPDNAFCGARNLTTYSYPSTVREIGTYAFAETKLTSLVIPANIEKIGGAIAKGSSIETIQVQGKNLTINEAAWYDAAKLTTLDYSNPELTVVPDYAFANLSNIESINIDDRFTEIGKYAFNGSRKLNNIIGARNVKVRWELLTSQIGTIKQI